MPAFLPYLTCALVGAALGSFLARRGAKGSALCSKAELEDAQALLDSVSVPSSRGERRETLSEVVVKLCDRTRHLHEIIDSEPECVKTVSADGRLLEMNPAGLRLIESEDFESVAGAEVIDLVHPDYREAFLEMHAAVIAGESRTLIFKLCALKGTERWMETHAVPFKEHGGRVLHLAITREITERKRREQELLDAKLRAESASRAKSEFLANMSHELRTPLTAILGCAELLEDDERTQADLDEGLATIRSSGRHLLGLISDVLDMNKIEASQMELEELPVDLGAMIVDVVETLGVQAAPGSVALRAIVPDERALVRTDAVRFRQVVINLVGNALKFTEEGSVEAELLVAPAPDGSHAAVRVIVRDTGIGMTEDHLARIFAPFTQADSSTRRRFGGTGLGLAISRRLAEMFGGALTATSVEGEGSTFELAVELARAKPEELAALDSSEAAPARAAAGQVTGRVLLVEDNPVNRRVIGAMLTRIGLEVHQAINGREGVEKAVAGTPDGHAFDAVLLDMHMPVMDGFEAARRLRDEAFPAPVIALTANALTSDRDECLAAGCDEFLSKPVQRDALAATLACYLVDPARICNVA